MKGMFGAIVASSLLLWQGLPGQALAEDTASSARLEAAIAGDHRAAANVARDQYRHPLQTLEFFGLQPTMTVIEIWPGNGWYSEILAPALRGSGTFIAASFGEDSAPAYRPRLHKELLDKFAARPDVYDQARVIAWDPPTQPSLGEPGSADMVLTFRNTHGWINDGVEKDVFKAMFEVLKPGGTLGVVQHRAKADADPAASAKLGYVPESHVVALATAAGFELVARSEINANPRDTADYEKGVWTLPPRLLLGEQDKARYLAIGESDRMTLRFRKPAN